MVSANDWLEESAVNLPLEGTNSTSVHIRQRGAPSKAALLELDLLRRLENKEWSDGEPLPDERSIAAKYAVARNTVRKALARLEASGLLRREVGRGTFAVPQPEEAVARILARFTNASPADILNLRLFIEPHAAAAAARSLSENEYAAISAAAAKAEQANELDEYEYWDNEFHRQINNAAGNRFLSDFFALLTIIRYTPTMMEIRRQWFSEARRNAYNEEHREILEALRNWDSDRASAAMRHHLLSRRRNYFGQ